MQKYIQNKILNIKNPSNKKLIAIRNQTNIKVFIILANIVEKIFDCLDIIKFLIS